MEIVNKTPFAVALAPFTTKAGVDHACVIIKATWGLGSGEEPDLAEQQLPIVPRDQRNGDAPDASIRYAADVAWPKAATDVALVGHAHPERGQQAAVDVGLSVGSLEKVVRVFGDRAWYRAGGAWVITPPLPIERVPLVYERAYGGRDTTDANPARHAWERRNPVGTGFAVAPRPERLEGLSAPNLEDPRQPLRSWNDRPSPAGFGFVDAYWEPRVRFGGTYDDMWRRSRAPLLPHDFDERFFNAAHPDLIVPGYLTGGEAVTVRNAGLGPRLSFRLPRRRLSTIVLHKTSTLTAEPRLDTVWIDADSRRLVTVWRAAFACPRSFIAIRAVFVKDGAPPLARSV
jgi:hypothetical protein